MNPVFDSRLRRKAVRDLLAARWRSLSIVVTIAVGVGVTSGSQMSVQTLLDTRDAILDECAGADLEIRFLPEDPGLLPDLGAVDGVRASAARLVFPAAMERVGRTGERIAAQAIFLDRANPAVDRLIVRSGSALDERDTSGVVLEEGFARSQGIAPGDSVMLTIGQARYASCVRGLAVSSEHMTASTDPESFIPQKGSLAVAFANLDRIAGRVGFRMVNSLLVRCEAGASRDSVRDALLSRMGSFEIEEVIPRERRFAYRFIETDLNALRIYAPAIALTLGGLSMLTAFLTFRRMVFMQSREIGTLRALGASRRRILSMYAFSAAVLGLSGVAMAVLPAVLIRDAFASIYGGAIGIPRIDRHFYIGMFVVPAVPALAGSVAAVLLPVVGLLRRATASTIRDVERAPARVTPFLARLLDLTAPMRITARWALRNLIRRPALTAMTVLVLATALGVAVAYRISARSMIETARAACAHEHWDLSVDFLHPVYPEEMEGLLALAGIERAEPFLSIGVDIEAGNGAREPASLLGVDMRSPMRDIALRSGRIPADGGADDVILSPDLARRLDVGPGDRILLRQWGREPVAVTVAGVAKDIVLNRVLAPLEDVRRWSGREEQSGGLFVSAQSGGAGPDRDAIRALPFVGSVIERRELQRAVLALLDEVFGIVRITEAISVGIALLFLLTSLNLAALERAAEYATLRSLGCDPPRLRGIVRTEGLAVAAVAAAASVPVGFAVSIYLNGRLERAWFPVTQTAHPLDLAPILAGFLLLTPVCVWPALRGIVAADLAATFRMKGSD